MKDLFQNTCLALMTGGVLWLVTHWNPPAPAQPVPVVVPAPQPTPRRPFREGAQARPFEASPNAPDGTEPQVDFPDAQWMKNIGSKLDGAGMCVFSAYEMMCRWAGFEEFRGFRDWCAREYPGGGYPEKLAKLVKAYCAAKNIPREVFDPDRDLIQVDASSDRAVQLIEGALKQGMMPCCTLYYAPRYGRGRIYHAVNCAHLDAKLWACLDNNFLPLDWCSREEGIKRATLNGRLWAYIIVRPGPPPLPRSS